MICSSHDARQKSMPVAASIDVQEPKVPDFLEPVLHFQNKLQSQEYPQAQDTDPQTPI